CARGGYDYDGRSFDYW
nr:immunoglobulin heavy chain junction region [Mus musculus]